VDYKFNSATSNLAIALLFIGIILITNFILFREEFGLNDNVHVYGEIFALLFLLVFSFRQLKSIDKSQSLLEKSATKIRSKKVSVHDVIESQLSEWGLTATEQEISYLILKGSSFKDIAEHRNVSVATIYKHADKIYKKSNVSSRHDFVGYFLDELTPDTDPIKRHSD